MPSVVLIHGVSSTGEWHTTAQKVLSAIFPCERIQYRFFHSWWGPIKVYVWPTALWLLLGMAALLCPLGWVSLVLTLLLLGVNLANCLCAERDWAEVREGEPALWKSPVVFAVLGILVSAFLFTDGVAGGTPTLPLIVALGGVCFFLDLREYADGCDHKPPTGVYGLGSLFFMLAISLGLWVFGWESHMFEPGTVWFKYFWPVNVLVGLSLFGLVEPHVRARFAFDLVHQRLAQLTVGGKRPHLIAHSLGTYFTGHILHEALSFRLHRVILTGCVLERTFPWGNLVRPAA
jgi:hypothetical protein